MINSIKRFLPHKRQDQRHYGKFIGSFNFLRLLSWNISHPKRLMNRLKWKTLFSNSKMKIKKYNQHLNGKHLDNKLSGKLGNFLKDGGLIVNNFFEEKKIDNFLNEYKNLIDKEKDNIKEKNSNQATVYKRINLYLSDALFDLWLDSSIIDFIEHSLGNKIYAREYPTLVYTKYLLDENLNSKDEYNQKYKGQNIQGPYFWHVDHTAGLVNLHILLEDIDNTCTHMQFLSKSNKYSNTRDLYSDETVKHSGHEVVDCIGKKGSIYFHNGNTLHRVVGKKNSSRLGLIFSFSTGSNIEFNCKNIFNGYSSSYDLKKMEKRKRNILKGLFPFEGVNDLIGEDLIKGSGQ